MVGALNADAEHSIATQIKIARVFYFLTDSKFRWLTSLICIGSGICFDAWPTTPSRRLHVHGEPCRERDDSHSPSFAKF
jgi:hypothetical protein